MNVNWGGLNDISTEVLPQPAQAFDGKPGNSISNRFSRLGGAT